MVRKYFSFRSFHRGTVLFEVLLAAVILSLAALAVIPLYTGWRSEKRLELAAEEVASAIRQVEILAKNESADYPSMSEGLTFFCETTCAAASLVISDKRGGRVKNVSPVLVKNCLRL